MYPNRSYRFKVVCIRSRLHQIDLPQHLLSSSALSKGPGEGLQCLPKQICAGLVCFSAIAPSILRYSDTADSYSYISYIIYIYQYSIHCKCMQCPCLLACSTHVPNLHVTLLMPAGLHWFEWTMACSGNQPGWQKCGTNIAASFANTKRHTILAMAGQVDMPCSDVWYPYLWQVTGVPRKFREVHVWELHWRVPWHDRRGDEQWTHALLKTHLNSRKCKGKRK